MMQFEDRIPTKPNRRKITHDDGSIESVVIQYDDSPTNEGTPLTAQNLNKITSDIVNALNNNVATTVRDESGAVVMDYDDSEIFYDYADFGGKYHFFESGGDTLTKEFSIAVAPHLEYEYFDVSQIIVKYNSSGSVTCTVASVQVGSVSLTRNYDTTNTQEQDPNIESLFHKTYNFTSKNKKEKLSFSSKYSSSSPITVTVTVTFTASSANAWMRDEISVGLVPAHEKKDLITI